jgi:hypothetical protein
VKGYLKQQDGFSIENSQPEYGVFKIISIPTWLSMIFLRTVAAIFRHAIQSPSVMGV